MEAGDEDRPLRRWTEAIFAENGEPSKSGDSGRVLQGACHLAFLEERSRALAHLGKRRGVF
jgi:hypothetical protein